MIANPSMGWAAPHRYGQIPTPIRSRGELWIFGLDCIGVLHGLKILAVIIASLIDGDLKHNARVTLVPL